MSAPVSSALLSAYGETTHSPAKSIYTKGPELQGTRWELLKSCVERTGWASGQREGGQQRRPGCTRKGGPQGGQNSPQPGHGQAPQPPHLKSQGRRALVQFSLAHPGKAPQTTCQVHGPQDITKGLCVDGKP